jgi:putative SOS response-associated peptidase YedK
VRALLAPAASAGLISYPVSVAVNSVRNNGPELVREVEPVSPGSGGSSDA